MDALRLHKTAHPETRFWLLSNFPNWGWRGDVSYHARGPHRQDYGDYDAVLRIVLQKLRAAGIALSGLTVDNPYDYLVGEHRSVNLEDPKSVDWLGRVRTFEDFAREQGLEFNLIVNSERGGQQSDEGFPKQSNLPIESGMRKESGSGLIKELEVIADNSDATKLLESSIRKDSAAEHAAIGEHDHARVRSFATGPTMHRAEQVGIRTVISI